MTKENCKHEHNHIYYPLPNSLICDDCNAIFKGEIRELPIFDDLIQGRFTAEQQREIREIAELIRQHKEES